VTAGDKRKNKVSLGILAGGQAMRLNGANKAFLRYEGEYLIQRIVNGLGTGFADSLVSARETDSRFNEMGLETVLDKREAFSGPLAGIEALLETVESDFLLTIPVDIKFMPVALIQSWLDQPCAPGMVLQDMNGLQPLLALWHVDSAKIVVSDALDQEQKSVQSVVTRLGMKTIQRTDFQIGNLNTPRDFETP